jgi:glutathione S-transferase
MSVTLPFALELISFKLCPFVQRSVILLKQKGVPFDIRFIDLSDKPKWFLDISPTGKVPVLRVKHESGEEDVLFESGTCCTQREHVL